MKLKLFILIKVEKIVGGIIMRIIYMVYREENSMVYKSQVLDYLKLLQKNKFLKIELIVFRHHKNLLNKEKVEKDISNYISSYKTFSTFPLLFNYQITMSAMKLKTYFKSKIKKNQDTIVICRGEIAAAISTKAFKNNKNVYIMFDNRGLPIEEMEINKSLNIAYKLNKKVKRVALEIAKNDSDIYSFVTNNLKKYVFKKYSYDEKKPFFIIPTLTKTPEINDVHLNKIKNDIGFNENNFYITYIGSVSAWQAIDKLFYVFSEIKKKYHNTNLIILSDGKIEIPNDIPSSFLSSIYIDSVKHGDVKYYLKISDAGLVFRDSNIVNKVAAPTKIAEYISLNVPILFSGEIGILDDLGIEQKLIIDVDKDEWMKKIDLIFSSTDKLSYQKEQKDYFDMEKNQEKILKGIMKLMENTGEL